MKETSDEAGDVARAAETSLSFKIIGEGLVVSNIDTELQRRDPTSPKNTLPKAKKRDSVPEEQGTEHHQILQQQQNTTKEFKVSITSNKSPENKTEKKDNKIDAIDKPKMKVDQNEKALNEDEAKDVEKLYKVGVGSSSFSYAKDDDVGDDNVDDHDDKDKENEDDEVDYDGDYDEHLKENTLDDIEKPKIKVVENEKALNEVEANNMDMEKLFDNDDEDGDENEDEHDDIDDIDEDDDDDNDSDDIDEDDDDDNDSDDIDEDDDDDNDDNDSDDIDEDDDDFIAHITCHFEN